MGWLVAVRLVAAEVGAREWNPGMLRDPGAWPHAESDLRLTSSAPGLQVEVAPGHSVEEIRGCTEPPLSVAPQGGTPC